MPRVSPPIDPDKLVKMYTDGASLGHLAREFRTRSVRIRSELEKCGVVVRTRSEQLRATPPRVTTIPNIETYAKRYLAGEGLNVLAIDANVAAGTMGKYLRLHGVSIRPPSADAAHAAVRGRKKSKEYLAKRAATNQRALHLVGPHEVVFADLLRKVGCEFVPQLKIGKYNVDFALDAPSIAVEIVAGSGNSRAYAGRADRVEDILNRGWHVVEVMIVGRTRGGPTIGAAEYIHALAKVTRGQPSGRGHHWMIWGDGEPYAANRRQFNNVA